MKKIKIQFLALAAAATLLGCGGTGGGKSQSADFSDGIYIGDYSNARLVRIADMSGAGWTENSDDFGQICGIDFSPQGKIMVAMANPEQIVQMDDMTGTNRINHNGAGLGILLFGNLKGVMHDSQERMIAVDGDPTKLRLVRLDNLSDTTAEVKELAQFAGAPNDQLHAAVDALDRIYVIYRMSGKLLRFENFEDDTPEIVGSVGTGVMQFDEPVDLHIDAQGRFYVAEFAGKRIVRFDDMSGTNWTTFGSAGNGVGQFGSANCVTTDSMGRIYVGDGGNDRIVRMDDMTGAGWVTFGTPGEGVGQLASPWEIYIKE